MKIERPRFELARVYADGAEEPPEIVPVTRMPWDTQMDRRGVLGVGIGAAAALFLIESRSEAAARDYGSFQAENALKAPEKGPLAHVSQVSELALTPDGKTLVSGSHDNTVKMWSMPQGEWLTTLPIHTSDVNDLAITPDGKTLVTASADTLRLWSLPEGQLRKMIDDHTDVINAIAITADGKLLVSGANDRTVRLWSLPEGLPLATLEGHPGPVQSLRLTANGKVLAAGSKEGRLKLWSLAEGRLLMTLGQHSAGRFAITPDSQIIAIGSYDIELRSLADGHLLATLKPGDTITALAMSPDGKTLACTSRESLFLWSLPEGKLIRKLEKVGYNVSNLLFSPDGRILFSIVSYGSSGLWSLPEGQLLAQLQTRGQTSAAIFTTDGQQLITGDGGGQIALWGLRPRGFLRYLSDPVLTASKPPDKTLRAHTEMVTALGTSADSRMLASSSNDRTAKLWSLPGGQLLASLDGHKESVTDVTITADGKTIITASSDKTIKLWALPDGAPPAPAAAQKTGKKAPPRTAKPTAPKGRLLTTLDGHQSGVRRILLSGDGSTLASIDLNGTTKIWSLPEAKLQATLPEQKGEMKTLLVAPDGKFLVTATDHREDRTVKIWALPEGRLLKTLVGFEGQITALTMAPDGKLLAVADSDNDDNIRLWELPGGRLVGSLEWPNTTALAISPDGKLLAASSGNGITLWALAEGRLLATLEEQGERGYRREQARIVFAPNGRWLLSLAAGGSIRLWSLPDGRLLATLEAPGSDAKAMTITPDSKTLATGDYSGVVTLWDLEKPGFRTFLFDVAVNSSEVKGITYNVYDKVTGQTITYTLPCGSPIPPGAVCTCNCVPGAERAYVPPPSRPSRRRGGGYSGGGGGGRTICTCNKICTCIPVSDLNLKEAFETADPGLILQRLSKLPVQTWNYKWDDPSIRHIGPMAQDFAAAFGVGEDEKHICPVDAQGVAFAAIQALHQIVRDRGALLDDLRTQLQIQQKEKETLQARVGTMERLLSELASERRQE